MCTLIVEGEWPRPELYPADEYAHLVEEGWEWVDD